MTNPNDFPVRITGITVDTVTAKPGCGKNQADLSFGAVPPNTVINPGPVAVPVALGSIKMGQAADPACANASFTVTAILAGEIAG